MNPIGSIVEKLVSEKKRLSGISLITESVMFKRFAPLWKYIDELEEAVKGESGKSAYHYDATGKNIRVKCNDCGYTEFRDAATAISSLKHDDPLFCSSCGDGRLQPG